MVSLKSAENSTNSRSSSSADLTFRGGLRAFFASTGASNSCFRMLADGATTPASEIADYLKEQHFSRLTLELLLKGFL